MPTYLDPKNDYAFKRVFGEHKNLCLSLLNALLPLPPDAPIVGLEFLSNEVMPENPLKKFSVVDVRCIDKSGRQFLVEMQWHWTLDFSIRTLFNAAKAYSGQVAKGASYYSPKPIYALNLLNSVFEKDIPDYYHHYKITHTKYPDKQMEGMEFVFVELPKFIPANRAERKLRDIWLKFLKEINLGTETVPKDLLGTPEVREALRYLEEGALSPKQRAVYDKEADRIRHEKSAMEGAEKIGEAKGRAAERAKAAQKLAAERAKAKRELAAQRTKAEQAIAAQRTKAEQAIAAQRTKAARELAAQRTKATQAITAERTKAEQAIAEERAKTETKVTQAASHEKLAIARNLLAKGVTPALIAAATKLSLPEIQKLSKKQKS